MRGLSFIHNSTERSRWKSKGISLLRRMIRKLPTQEENANSSSLTNDIRMSSPLQPMVLLSTSLRLQDAFDVAGFSADQQDVIAKYMSRTFARPQMDNFKTGLDELAEKETLVMLIELSHLVG